MSLRPVRDVNKVDLNFGCPNTCERGGLLSTMSISGVTVVQYAKNPTDGQPIGILLNDIEWVNYGYQTPPQYKREVGVPGELIGIAIDGLFETDWIFLSGQIYPGTPAYAGPSGMITNTADFGGKKVGFFYSQLIEDPHVVVYAGLGFYRHYMEPRTHNIIDENNPADQIKIATPGYAKVYISQGAMTP